MKYKVVVKLASMVDKVTIVDEVSCVKALNAVCETCKTFILADLPARVEILYQGRLGDWKLENSFIVKSFPARAI